MNTHIVHKEIKEHTTQNIIIQIGIERHLHRMKQRKGKQTRISSMKQNELVNKQQIEETSNNAQLRGNKIIIIIISI